MYQDSALNSKFFIWSAIVKKYLLIVLTAFLFTGLFTTGQAYSYDKPAKYKSIKEAKKARFVEDEILVKFKAKVNESDEKRILKKLGALSAKASYGNRYHVVKVKSGNVPKMVKLFSENPNIEYAEPNYVVQAYFTPNDEIFPFQWHLKQINCEKAWDISTGKGVVVAVIDSGVSSGGSDGFNGNLIIGKNFIPFSRDPEDENGHGTHVAGTIAQATDNGIGTAGVAFDATILAVKVLGRFGFGSSSGVTDGIRWAADNGAHIINMSLGGPDSSITMERAVNEAHNKGVVLIAAAGNESSSFIGFPAAYDNVIAVGSVRFDKKLSFFSNFGKKLDIVAPGGDTGIDQNGDDVPDGIIQETFQPVGFLRLRERIWDFFLFQGTSQASPHVAGVAALILEQNPEFTPETVRDALQFSAKDLGTPGKDLRFGWGLVDAFAALQPDATVMPTPAPTPVPEPVSSKFRNGGFETGDFSNWTAGDNGLNAFMPWEVCQASGCGWFNNNEPVEGGFNAVQGFDGAKNYEAFLYQDIIVPKEGGEISYHDRIQFDSQGIRSKLPRIYETQIRDLNNGELKTLHHQEILLNGKPVTDLGRQKRIFDVSEFAGQTIRVYINLFVPERATGPAQIEFDDFKLTSFGEPEPVETPTPTPHTQETPEATATETPDETQEPTLTPETGETGEETPDETQKPTPEPGETVEETPETTSTTNETPTITPGQEDTPETGETSSETPETTSTPGSVPDTTPEQEPEQEPEN